MPTDSPTMTQWPDDDQQDSSKAYAISGRIMLASIITLFVIVFFLVLLHLYARWYLTRLHTRNDTRGTNMRNRGTRVIYHVEISNNSDSNNNRVLASGSTGLDASVVNSLPLFVYSSGMKTKTTKNMNMNMNMNTNMNMLDLECAVCLSEFEEGEMGRVLPNCKHRFHTGCIDMWFFSHSTCPLCRSLVTPVHTEIKESVSVPVPVLASVSVPIAEPMTVPVPVPSSSAPVMEMTVSEERTKRINIRIDVPVNDSVTESPSQGFRSPGSRLLSFRRIMNMGRVPPMVSPSGVGPSCDSVATESGVDSARQELDLESRRQGGLG